MNAKAVLQREWLLGVAVASSALFLLFGKGWLADLSNPWWFALMLVWLFSVIMGSGSLVAAAAVLCLRYPSGRIT